MTRWYWVSLKAVALLSCTNQLGTSATVQQGRAANNPGVSDTARGTVSVQGSAPAVQIALLTGTQSLALSGAIQSLRGLHGAEVWVGGRFTTPKTLQVTRFLVRAVDNVPALDGTLLLCNDELFVHTHEGKSVRIGGEGTTIRQHVGGRVWVSGLTENGITSYGVIFP